MKRLFFLFLLLFTDANASDPIIRPAGFPYGAGARPTNGPTPGTTTRVPGTINRTGYSDNPSMWTLFIGGADQMCQDTNELYSINPKGRLEFQTAWVKDIGFGTNVPGMYILKGGIDNTNWLQLAYISNSLYYPTGAGTGANIYNSDGTVPENRTVTGSGIDITFTGFNDITLLATNFIYAQAPYVVLNSNVTNGFVQIQSNSSTTNFYAFPYVNMTASGDDSVVFRSKEGFVKHLPPVTFDEIINAVTNAGPTIYTGDGALPENRVVDADGHDLSVINAGNINLASGSNTLSINGGAGFSDLVGVSQASVQVPSGEGFYVTGTTTKIATTLGVSSSVVPGWVFTATDIFGGGEWAESGASAQNIANANLTFDGDHTTDGDGFEFNLINFNTLSFGATNGILVQAPSVAINATDASGFVSINQNSTTTNRYIFPDNRSLPEADDAVIFRAPGDSGNGGHVRYDETITYSILTNLVAGSINFANTDLTFTGDRTHDAAGFFLDIGNMSLLNLSGVDPNSHIALESDGAGEENLEILTAAGNEVTVRDSASSPNQNFVRITTATNSQFRLQLPSVNDGSGLAGQFLRRNDTLAAGDSDFATVYYVGLATGTPGTWVAATSTLVPAYDSGAQPPEGAIAYLKFNANSVGSDTLQLGDSTTGIAITRADGLAIQADDITAGQYIMFVRAGTSSGSHWVCESCGSSAAPAPGDGTLMVVDSVADLVALDTSTTHSAATLGYYSPNDGGSGAYYWVADQTSTNHGAKIASADTGSWVLLNGNLINVLQWGVDPTGTDPAGARINEAFSYGTNISGAKRLWIPGGQYAIEETVFLRYGNAHLRINGHLKNVAGTNDSTLVISPNWLDHSIAITNGVPFYEVNDITVDGEGVGIIDQNSQNATPFEYDDPDFTSFHSLVGFGVNNLTVKGLTLTNGIIWSMAIECCNNVVVSGNNVYTGFCNNRLVDGVPTYLGGQDGIHLHDTSNGSINDNYVISGDDAIAVTAARTFAHDVTVQGNKPSVRAIAYEANGTTENTNSISGRFALAAYTAAQTADCGLTNVTFSANIVDGGTGLFTVYDDDATEHDGITSNIRFIGNAFTGQISPGATSPVPSISFGWYLNGSSNVEFVGNTFKNIARKGIIGGSYGTQNGIVTFKENLFTDYQVPYPPSLYAGEPESIIWMLNNSSRLVVEGNTFQNNAILPIMVGSAGDTTTNVFISAKVTGNTFINNNTRYSGGSPTNYSAALAVYGANFVEFSRNLVSTNYGVAVQARGVYELIAEGNNLRSLGVTTPTVGTYAVNDKVIGDSTNPGGQAYYCSVAGTPGTWTALTTGYVAVPYARTDAAQSFAGDQTFNANVVLTDIPLVRDAAATLQIGLDSATPADQLIKGPDGSGSNIGGGKVTIEGGRSTGTGAGGAVKVATSLSGSSGSSLNTYSTRSFMSAKPTDLTEASATTFCNITLPDASYLGCRLSCTVFASDGTDHQTSHSPVTFSAVNKAGTITISTVTVGAASVAASSGTLTPVTYTVVQNGNSVDVKVAATSSLTQTILRVKWAIIEINSNGDATVTAY